MFKPFRKIFCTWVSAIILTATYFSTAVFAIDSKMQMTGANFSNSCTRADDNWISFCNGYIQAVVDSIRENDGICFPNGVSRADLVTVAEREITASGELQAINAHCSLGASTLRSGKDFYDS